MHMVGHDDVTPYVPAVKRAGIFPNLGEDGMGDVIGQQVMAMNGAGGDEINRLANPYATKPREVFVPRWFHRIGCSRWSVTPASFYVSASQTGTMQRDPASQRPATTEAA